MCLDGPGRALGCDPGPGAGSRLRRLPRCLAVGVFFLLAGCGTNIPVLIEEEGRLLWRGDQALEAASFDPDLQTPLYDAESEMQRSCESINRAVATRRDTPNISVAAQFRSDLALVIALLLPIKEVETCATAQAHYRQTLAALCQRLDELSSRAACPNHNLP